VALLVERAANWADIPLERWLKEVIQEEPTMKRLQELLGIRPK
jgi:type VI secretion system protein ImpA